MTKGSHLNDPILLCDFGGTHGRLGLFLEEEIHHLKKYELSNFATHIELFKTYQNETDVTFKKIAVAGAGAHFSKVYPSGFQQNSKISQDYFAEHGFELLFALNDFEASAWGILSDQNKEQILRDGAGKDDGHISCLIGPGTGLGCAYVSEQNNIVHVIPTHGGHMRPSPATKAHCEIVSKLQSEKDEAVIYEDIASGRGLKQLYKLLKGDELKNVYQILDQPDDPVHKEILAYFHDFLGLYIQHCVVTVKSYKGIYLTGGLLDIIMKAGVFDFSRVENMINQKYVSTIEAALKNTPIIYIDDTYLALYGLKKYLEYYDYA